MRGGQLREATTHPTDHVGGAQLELTARRFAKPGDLGDQELVGDGAPLAEERVERVGGHHERLDLAERHRARGPGLTVDRTQLADDLAGAAQLEHCLPPAGGRLRELHGAREDGEHRPGRVALTQDQLARPVAADPAGGAQGLEVGHPEPTEEGRGGERRRAHVRHRRRAS